ncbi:hypothetical protein G5V59_25785 [Nocardioides sp. W3-2-3]|uniref:hypothetical protein n=1 Tax=Nocardioides convexus TaxID=2712224 RepID=UPI0024181992|nr:hypothetical protein [Nocardioides convexus]NHA01898.1 hypothetical protein [Nocardioides convexus]
MLGWSHAAHRRACPHRERRVGLPAPARPACGDRGVPARPLPGLDGAAAAGWSASTRTGPPPRCCPRCWRTPASLAPRGGVAPEQVACWVRLGAPEDVEPALREHGGRPGRDGRRTGARAGRTARPRRPAGRAAALERGPGGVRGRGPAQRAGVRREPDRPPRAWRPRIPARSPRCAAGEAAPSSRTTATHLSAAAGSPWPARTRGCGEAWWTRRLAGAGSTGRCSRRGWRTPAGTVRTWRS